MDSEKGKEKTKMVERARCEWPADARDCGVKRCNPRYCGTCDFYDPKYEVVSTQPREK